LLLQGFHLSVKDVTEMAVYIFCHGPEIHIFANEFIERSHAVITDSARDNQFKIVEIGCDIESEAVHRHPSGDPDTDCGKLLVADPDSGQAVNPSGFYAKIGRRPDENFLQIADIFPDVASIRRQLDYRIADKLARSVIGHIPAATGFKQLDPESSPHPFVGKDIGPVRGAPKRDYMRMLELQKPILNLVSFSLVDQALLQLMRLGVWNKAKITGFADAQQHKTKFKV
jgi:hypothetical protein